MSTSPQFTRRGFLTGAGIAAAGLVSTSLVGCQQAQPLSSTSEKNGQETSDSGRWSWSTPPDEISENDITETIDCEILVCGYGSAGVPAAVYAAAQGANTVVLTAGNVPEAEGAYCGVYNSKHDAEFDIEYDPAYWKRRLVMEGVGAVEMPTTGMIYDRSGDAVDWFAEYMNEKWPYYTTSEATQGEGGDGIHDGMNVIGDHVIYCWPDRSETNPTLANYHGFPKLLEQAHEQAVFDGARVFFSTPLERLITNEEGNVTGAYGKKEDGTYVKVNASKGVLLATGDFHQNEEMLECFCPEMCGDLVSRNPYGNAQGGGHKAAYWAGAHLDAGSYMFGLCWPHDFLNEKFPPQAWALVPYLRVNIKGQRYTNEELGSHEQYSTSPLCLADARQPDHTGYQILDSKYGELLDAAAFDQFVERGIIHKGETLQELAEVVGVDANILEETVARYNELCEKGSDDDCGVDSKWLASTSITEPPFYCMDHPVYKQSVSGGVRTDQFMRVYRDDRTIINGLYAAGNIRSGACGPHYSWTGFGGTNKMNAMAGGMLAIKHMLGTWEEKFVQ